MAIASFLSSTLPISAGDFPRSFSNDCLSGVLFRALAPKYAADAAHDAAHGKNTFIIGKEYFTDAAATIVPTFEQRQMLHDLGRGPYFRRRERIENSQHSRFHRLRLRVLGGLDREHHRPGDGCAFDAEEGDAVREMAGLNDQRRKTVEAAGYLGELAEDWPQLFQADVSGGSFFKCEIGRCGVALR